METNLQSTIFTSAKKVRSGLLFVNHLQTNNPLLLEPAGKLKIVHNRSLLYINTYKPFFLLIKKVKSFFNVTAEVAEDPQAIQMLKSFDCDFFGFVSSIRNPTQEFITNSYVPGKFNLPDAEIDIQRSDKFLPNKNSLGAPFDFTHMREITLTAKDATKNLCANYFAPVPQALSTYQERSDVVPLSVDMQDVYEKVYFKEGQYFLTANFAHNVMAANLGMENFVHVKDGGNVDDNNPLPDFNTSFVFQAFGNVAPEKIIATQHGVQFWVELYLEN